MASIIYLNGEFLPLAEAKISVLDRGFLFGDGVYEVIPVYQGKAFRVREHIQRLERSLAATQISLVQQEQDWIALFEAVIARNRQETSDLSLYIQVTRGVSAKRDHAFPADAKPTLFMMATPVVYGADLGSVKSIRAITLPDNRWTRCYIKSICLLPNVLLKQTASQQGVEDAILIREGYLTESSSANVFIVKNGVVYTPPKTDYILGGITRDLIVELGEQGSFDCREQEISEQELLQADEVWVTSSTREIIPVTELNGKSVGNGKIGPLWYNVAKRYQAYKAELVIR